MLKIRRPLGRLIFNMGIAIPGKTVFLIETALRSIQANLTSLMSNMSNIKCDFSVIVFWDTWLNSSNIDTYGIDGYSHVGINRESVKGGWVSLLYLIILCILDYQNLIWCVNILNAYLLRWIIGAIRWFLGLSTDSPTETLLIRWCPAWYLGKGC